jgi:hypothetical protein
MPAPFRIYSRRSGRYAVSVATEEQVPQIDDYRGRLMKLIPGEVIVVYLAGYAWLAPGDFGLHLLWCIICLVGLGVYRVRGTSDQRHHKPPQFFVVLVSAIAFVIWAYASGGPFRAWDLAHPDAMKLHDPKIAALLTIGYTFLVAPFLV